jgi:hypothetical protein
MVNQIQEIEKRVASVSFSGGSCKTLLTWGRTLNRGLCTQEFGRIWTANQDKN